MLTECRQALRITTTAYDNELCSLMKAGAADLRTAGVVIPGTVNFRQVTTTTGQTTETHWEDAGHMDDALVLRAILTYVRMLFGSPDDFNQIKESYETQKCQLMHATGYTSYGGADEAGDC